MADKNLELALKIKADLQQAIRETRQLEEALLDTGNTSTRSGQSARSAASGIGALGSSAATAASNTSRATDATRQYDSALNAAERSSRNLGETTEAIGGGMTALAAHVRAVTLTLAAGFGLTQIIQSADAWTAYENRLRLVTSTQTELAQSSADVYQIARATSQQLDSTAAVYQRFTQNAERLNITQQQSARLTETVSKAIAISGGSAASAEAALVQFGQGLASGVLRGEEFNSVMEQAPGLAMALADGLNVDIGKLREMANEGQLTADVLVDALSAAADSVDQQFETRVRTISQAATEFNTAFTRLVGTLSSGTGAGEGIADAIGGLADVLDGLSDNIDIVGDALEVALILTAGRVISTISDLSKEGLKQILVQKAQATATAQKALADEGAAISAKKAAISDLEKARSAVTAAEATVTATAAEAKRTATAAASAAGLSTKAALDAKATQAALLHSTAEAKLTVALETRVIATEAAAVATATATRATAAAATAAAAASAATNLLTRAVIGLTAVGGRILTMLGGPLGIIVSIGLAATAFIDFGDDAQAGMDQAANATEQASVRIRNASRDIIRDLNIGSVDTASFDQLELGVEQLSAMLSQAKETRDYIQQLQDTDIPLWDDSMPTLDQANERVRALESALAKLRQEQGSSRFEGTRAAEEYLDALIKENERLQQLSDREEALKFLREEGIETTSALGQKILEQVDANGRLAESNDKAAESQRKKRQAEEDAARTSEQRSNAQRTFVQQLEQTVALQGKSAAEVREYRLSEQGLTGQLLARARAANAAITAQEQLNQVMKDGQQLARIQAQILELSGDPVGARSLQLEQQFGDLMSRLTSGPQADEAGAALVRKLINLDLARTQLSALQSEIDAAVASQSRAEESVNIQQDAGLISELEARDRILQIHRQTFQILQQQRPLLEELSKQPGVVGEQASVMLQQLDNQMAQLQSTTTLLGSTLKDGLENGIAGAIRGLADGTMTLRDAAVSLLSSVADAMIDMLARVAAQQAVAGLAGMFPGVFTLGLSTGGHVRGPGTETSDSIPARLSNNEFVTRAAVVTQPGALPFLSDFNERGMAALNDWADRVRHATGGLAGMPAPSMNSPQIRQPAMTQPEQGANGQPIVVQVNNAIDPDDMAQKVLSTGTAVRQIKNMVKAEKSSFNAILER